MSALSRTTCVLLGLGALLLPAHLPAQVRDFPRPLGRGLAPAQARGGTIYSTNLSDGTGISPTQPTTQPTTLPDGTVVTRHPDGTIETHSPDGTRTLVYPDGTRVTRHTDGTISVASPDGNVAVYRPNGQNTHVHPDGTIVNTFPDGTRIVQNPNGTTVIYFPDGTVAHFKESPVAPPPPTQADINALGGTPFDLQPQGAVAAPRPLPAASADVVRAGLGPDAPLSARAGRGRWLAPLLPDVAPDEFGPGDAARRAAEDLRTLHARLLVLESAGAGLAEVNAAIRAARRARASLEAFVQSPPRPSQGSDEALERRRRAQLTGAVLALELVWRALGDVSEAMHRAR